MLSSSHARRAVTVGALLAVVMVGCTDSADEPGPAPTTTTTASPSPTPSPTRSPTPEPTEEPTLDSHGVSAAHPLAVEAGMEILDAGGSAVDAAIATGFAVTVVEPFASSIGGGGSAIVAPTGAAPQGYDYREEVAQDGRIPASGTGVPGFVAGMAALHEDHGELPWDDLLAPAIELAADGFPVSDFLALRMRSDYGPGAVNGLDHYAPGGSPLSAGQTLVQERLAGSLRTIADGGARAFYTGAIADQLAGVDGLDAGTLAAYEVVRSDPVSGQVGDFEVLSAAPPLPGVALIQMLQVAEGAGVAESTMGSADYIETLSRAWQVADETANTVLGDPSFVDVPVGRLTDPAENAAVAEQVMAAPPPDGAGDGDVVASTAHAGGHDVVPGNTTHVTVVDSDGLMVSMTNTLTSFWGSGEMVAGFFLNNQLSRFEAISSPANQPEPGRRSVSWSAPTVVLDGDGRPVLGIGSPGGHQIPNILSNVIVRWALHGQTLEEAVAAPRFILEGGTLTTERHPPSDVAAALADLGWAVDVVPVEDAVFGSAQVLEVDHGSGEITGTADSRREADFAVGRP